MSQSLISGRKFCRGEGGRGGFGPAVRGSQKRVFSSLGIVYELAQAASSFTNLRALHTRPLRYSFGLSVQENRLKTFWTVLNGLFGWRVVYLPLVQVIYQKRRKRSAVQVIIFCVLLIFFMKPYLTFPNKYQKCCEWRKWLLFYTEPYGHLTSDKMTISACTTSVSPTELLLI